MQDPCPMLTPPSAAQCSGVCCSHSTSSSSSSSCSQQRILRGGHGSGSQVPAARLVPPRSVHLSGVSSSHSLSSLSGIQHWIWFGGGVGGHTWSSHPPGPMTMPPRAAHLSGAQFLHFTSPSSSSSPGRQQRVFPLGGGGGHGLGRQEPDPKGVPFLSRHRSVVRVWHAGVASSSSDTQHRTTSLRSAWVGTLPLSKSRPVRAWTATCFPRGSTPSS